MTTTTTTTTMQAAVVTEFGKDLQIQTLPVPVPGRGVPGPLHELISHRSQQHRERAARGEPQEHGAHEPNPRHEPV